MNMPPSVCDGLQRLGYEAVHAQDLGLSRATDEAIVLEARTRKQIIVTHDLDFGRILAVEGASTPSVVILRVGNTHPSHLLSLLGQYLPVVASDLTRGAIVLVEDASVRVRALPVGSQLA